MCRGLMRCCVIALTSNRVPFSLILSLSLHGTEWKESVERPSFHWMLLLLSSLNKSNHMILNGKEGGGGEKGGR